MKKKLFWGISLLAICLTFFKCYGPKPKDHCLCENDVECKDLKGCR